MSMLKPLLGPREILALSTEEVCALVPENFDRILTQPEVTHIFTALEAFWQYNGDASLPHALLVSLKHSTGFINCRFVLSYTNLCQIFAHQMVRLIRQHYDGPIHWVLGSSTAACDLSKDIANIFGARHDIFAVGSDRDQIWKGPKIKQGEIIVRVEELMTTAFTAKAVTDGLVKAHEKIELAFAPFVFVLMHRSKTEEIDGAKVVAFAHYDMDDMDPLECAKIGPCGHDSEAIKPKLGNNWQRLKKGYLGEPCKECGQFTVVRCGVAVKCQSCGATSGCS